MSKNYKLIDNKKKRQYEFEINGLTPRIEYISNHEKYVYLTYTEVPCELYGKGVVGELIKEVLADISKKKKYVVPFCPVVAAYIQRYPQWKQLIAQA